MFSLETAKVITLSGIYKTIFNLKILSFPPKIIMRQIVLFLSLFIVLIGFKSCKDADENQESHRAYLEKHAEAFAKKFDLSTIPNSTLNQEAQNATSNWTEFLAAQSEIENIKNYSLQKLINNSDNLSRAAASLMDSIPDKFDKTPVESRINVLITKTKILNQYAQRNVVDTTIIQHSGQDIYKAFGNLKVQLNEVFLTQFEGFDITIDQKQDSIQKTKHQEEN